jgi:hypothetical protein
MNGQIGDLLKSMRIKIWRKKNRTCFTHMWYDIVKNATNHQPFEESVWIVIGLKWTQSQTVENFGSFFPKNHFKNIVPKN